jgi:hypothetical protein
MFLSNRLFEQWKNSVDEMTLEKAIAKPGIPEVEFLSGMAQNQ